MTTGETLGYITSVLDLMGLRTMLIGFLIFIVVIGIIFRLGK